METLELLLADRVRTLAAQFRKEAYEKAAEDAGDDWPAVMAQWDADNPRAAFIEDAHSELTQIALHLRRLPAP